VRVLVVEDCRRLADLVAEGLSDQAIAADVACDGIEAAGKLAVTAYDVVVLERAVPGVPGDTLCRMISGSNGRAMVLLLSAAPSPEERVDGLGLGADDYMAKPFHFPELVMRVRALACRRPRAMPRVLRVGETPSAKPTSGRWLRHPTCRGFPWTGTPARSGALARRTSPMVKACAHMSRAHAGPTDLG